MAEIIFNYEGQPTVIQCNIDDKMKDIIDIFKIKIDRKEKNLNFLYNDKKIDEELKFNELANEEDKNRMKMDITVNNIDENEIKEDENEIKEEKNEIKEEKNEIKEDKNEIKEDKNEIKEDKNEIKEDKNEIKEEKNEIKEDKNEIKEDKNEIKIENQVENNNNILKDIICPICKENCLLCFSNFKINLYDCKNNHKTNSILLNKYENLQQIDMTKITCKICEKNNMSNTPNNEFYICNTCNIDICPSCKLEHDKEHKIINYTDKNYFCNKHSEIFTKYCKTCKEDICQKCENDHNKHTTVDLKGMLVDKNDLLKIMDELKSVIDRFKHRINHIKEIFDKMLNILDNYYKINNDIILNYDINKKYYHKLMNLYSIKINNGILINEIKQIVNNGKVNVVYDYCLDNFYNEKGERYIGEMKNGLKHGKGTLYYDKYDKTQKFKYEGEFKDDVLEGKGTIFWRDGDKYEGDFKKGIKDGKGIYSYINGDRYEGEFKNELKEGKGIYSYINGDRYEGEFKNGKIEGNGTMYFKNGEVAKGYWKNDQLVEQ